MLATGFLCFCDQLRLRSFEQLSCPVSATRSVIALVEESEYASVHFLAYLFLVHSARAFTKRSMYFAASFGVLALPQP